MVTLKDVAERAGVSVATVSYCITGKKSVKPETLLKVREAISELNYIPNYSARNLKNSVSDEIGVILPNLDDTTNSEILKGIIAQAEPAHYSVHIACSYNNPRNEQEIIKKFVSKNYAGIILMTCQTQNSSFFRRTLDQYGISHVFIMRLPQKISSNFLGFDNYSTVFYLTEQLLRKGYTNIALLTGPLDFFSENECVSGYSDAHDKYGLEPQPENILCTDMSKEGSFKETMLYLSTYLPQAIISSSLTIMDGVLEACNVHNILPGGNICLITLSEERWNRACYHPDVIQTAATAYTLGEDSFRILTENNHSSQLYDRRFKLFKDKVVDMDLCFPALPLCPPQTAVPQRYILRIASVDLPTIRAIQAVSCMFSSQSGILLTFDFFSLHDLFLLIEEDSQKQQPHYDLYLTDVSWMSYFFHKDIFLDITELLMQIPGLWASIFPKNLENARIHGRYYGFPVIGGTQFLFYRKDLFEDPLLQKQYKEAHHISLRPPKTWTEYNQIARFFTREYNPHSPTRYGTAIPTNLREDFISELLIRMWGFEGGLADSKGQLRLNTPQNVRALNNMLETTRYSPPRANQLGAGPNAPHSNLETTFEQIGNGSIAMAISFTEYASRIQNSLHPEFLSKIGYHMLPGGIPVNVGWHLCIPRRAQALDSIRQLFRWLCQRQNSYYQTILCGQSTLLYPHASHELLRLYPWLNLTAQGLSYCRSRTYPVKGKHQLIVPADFESAIHMAFQKMKSGELSVEKALEACQANIIHQFF